MNEEAFELSEEDRNILKEYGFRGFSIDFSNVDPIDAAALINFMEERLERKNEKEDKPKAGEHDNPNEETTDKERLLNWIGHFRKWIIEADTVEDFSLNSHRPSKVRGRKKIPGNDVFVKFNAHYKDYIDINTDQIKTN